MLLSISVDLDEIRHYGALHGVVHAESDGLVYARAVPRLAAWARERGIPLTWFAVGRDLEQHEHAEAARRLAMQGDEFACHTYSHPYDLTRMPVSEMQREIERGVAAIAGATGLAVSGFRAPGYVVTDTLLALLREQGFLYDASVFPCPSYYALKALAVTGKQMRRTPTQAIVDGPEVLRAPRVPYRVGQPYWFRGGGILEIPIQVTRKARLPFIGTALTLAGTMGARLLARGVLGEPFVNLELHGLDALDQRDGLSALAKSQHDLRIPWTRKLEAIDAAVAVIRGRGYRCVRMDQLAAAASA